MNPFRGLVSYRREDKDILFGREDDFALIMARIASRRTTLLFAGSGVGKTSFLKAKVIPEIEDEYLVCYFADWGTRDPRLAICEAIGQAYRASVWGAGAPDDAGAENSIPGVLKDLGVRTVLILDQFEELFQNHWDFEHSDGVIRELAAVINSTELNVNVVFAMREDFLGELSAFDNKIPDVFANYYRLKNPNRKQALEIIRATARSCGIPPSNQLGKLLDDLTWAGPNGSRAGYRSRETISPPYLQIACRRLWEKQPPTEASGFPAAYQDGAASAAVGDYCSETLDPLPAQEKEVISEALGFLITRQGAKIAYELASLATHLGRPEEKVAAALRKLSDPKVRILREYQSRGAETWFELYHDMYAPFLSEWNAQYRKQQKTLLQRARRKWRSLAIIGAAAAIALAIGGFYYYRDYKATHTELTATQNVLYTAAYEVPRIANLYNFPAEFKGKGQCVGAIALGGGYQDSDLRTYFERRKISLPDVEWVGVNGAKNTPGSSTGEDSEVTMNIEVVGAVASSAKIVVYFAPNTHPGFVAAVNAAVNDRSNRVSVLLITWGGAESNWTGNYTGLNTALKRAAAAGITVVVASDDYGVTDGQTNPDVDFPGSSPWVLTTGGTRLLAVGDKIVSETVWNDLSGQGGTGGATGGGVSSVFPAPDWQSGLNVVSLDGGRRGRAVPDVAASAAPANGYKLYVNGQNQTLGGTAASASLWAGLVAVLNEGLGRNIGYFNPILYQQLGPEGVLRPITQGDNSTANVKGYSAGPGWNACTGWGTPDGRKLLSALKRIYKVRSNSTS